MSQDTLENLCARRELIVPDLTRYYDMIDNRIRLNPFEAEEFRIMKQLDKYLRNEIARVANVVPPKTPWYKRIFRKK